MLGLTPSGRRVIVTGATGGIGRALAETLLACDCAVAACDVPGAPVGDVTAVTATFDVRDPKAVRRGVADAIESLGGCDAVIANAGIVDTIHRAERFSDEEWRQDIETNLSGAFWVVQAAFEALLASGDGRIVLISSVAAEVGLPGQVAYGASKAGIVGMARTLAAEWGPRGIRCNAVMPGMIATPRCARCPRPRAMARWPRSRSAVSASPRSWPASPPSCSRRRRRTSTERSSGSTAGSACRCDDSGP